MDNKDFLAWVTKKITREIDVGDFAPARKGEMLNIWVNAPGVVKAIYGGRERHEVTTTDDKGNVTTETTFNPIPADDEYARMRQAVAILFEMPPEQVALIDDSTLLWLYNRGWQEYAAYRVELRENLPNG